MHERGTYLRRMRSLIVPAVIASTGVAAAQPGMVPPAYSYQPAQPLSDDDRALLERGEISHDQIVGGAVLEGVFGFGLGQAYQHRWTQTGWIYTFGEAGSFVTFMDGVFEGIRQCDGPRHGGPCSAGSGVALGGAIALFAFRVIGTIDAAVVPRWHNAKVRALRARLAPPQVEARVVPYVAPYVASGAATGTGGVAGFALRF